MENDLRDAMNPIFVNSSLDSLKTSLPVLMEVLSECCITLGRDSVCKICDEYMRTEVRATSINAMLISLLTKCPVELAEVCSTCLGMLSSDTVACGVRSGQKSRLTIVPNVSLDLEYGEYGNDWTACRVWPGGELLSRHLLTNIFSVNQCDVLELGSGLGICGISALLAGASRVAFTESKDELLDVCMRNVAHNVPINICTNFVLDWSLFDPLTHEKFVQWKSKDFVVIGSEIIYEEIHADMIYTLLDKLFIAGASRAYIVVMSRPFRSGLSSFLKMLEEKNSSFTATVTHDSDAACIVLNSVQVIL